MQRLLTVMGDHPSAWAFDHPVNADEVSSFHSFPCVCLLFESIRSRPNDHVNWKSGDGLL
jgi:hypothetical protein